MPQKVDKLKSKIKAIGFVLLSITLIVVFLLPSFNQNRKTELRSKPFYEPRSERFQSDRIDMATSLIMDSILSIVQSYYVDEERINNRSLLDITLSNLNRDPSIIIQNNKNYFNISVGEEVIRIENSKELSYQELLEVSVDIASFLSKNLPVTKENPVDTKGSFWEDRGSFKFLNSMLEGLDPHSSLLNAGSYRDLRQGTEGAFGGLGVVVGVRDDLLTVIRPLPNSPAINSGILKNDKIISINKVITYGVGLESLINHMRGPPGSAVDLKLMRKGELYPRDISIKRQVIRVDSVESKMVEDGILHLVVESFSSRTALEVKNHIISAQNKLGGDLDGLILDLRSNPGGLLDQAVSVADLFLENGKIVSTKGRREEIEIAEKSEVEFGFPVFLMMNSESASASEIVAGALQDNMKAIIIGQPSFGKGSVQTIFELPGDQALKLTIARYYTPKGNSIQNVGISPDIWLQPVSMSDKNNNLLGLYRYKNEMFLSNNLGPVSGAQDENVFKNSMYKAYYLIDDGLVDYIGDVEKDVELQFAIGLASNLSDRMNEPNSYRFDRSSYWLSVLDEYIDQKIFNTNRKSIDWLSNNMDVDWSKKRSVFIDRSKTNLMLNTGSFSVEKGERILLPWSIKNNERFKVERVSIFVRSDERKFDTTEILVGSIRPGEYKKGHLIVPVDTTLGQKKDLVQLGLAVDSMPLSSPLENIEIDTSQVKTPQISINFTMEEQGGQIAQVIEPREIGEIKILLENKGEITANNLKVEIQNLSGKQLNFRILSKRVSTIKPKGSRYITFPFRSGKIIAEKSLSFGVRVSVDEFSEPIKKHMVVVSDPNMKKEKISNLFGR